MPEIASHLAGFSGLGAEEMERFGFIAQGAFMLASTRHAGKVNSCVPNRVTTKALAVFDGVSNNAFGNLMMPDGHSADARRIKSRLLRPSTVERNDYSLRYALSV